MHEAGIPARAIAQQMGNDAKSVYNFIRRLHAPTGYRARPTGTAISAGMNYLTDLIVRPGIEKKFGPLLLYRGRMNYGHAHRLWNGVLLMMASEAETLADGVKLFNNPNFSQLCGPVRAPQKITMNSFIGRLTDNPRVTKLIPGLTDYIKSLGLGECTLTPVDRFSEERFCAPWRKSIHPHAGEEPPERGIPKSQQLFYPYMVHDKESPDEGAALVKLVNSVVPGTLPEDIRADVCQDLIIGILSGDIAPGRVHDFVEEHVSKAFKVNPTRFEGTGFKTSMNLPITGTDDRYLVDTV